MGEAGVQGRHQPIDEAIGQHGVEKQVADAQRCVPDLLPAHLGQREAPQFETDACVQAGRAHILPVGRRRDAQPVGDANAALHQRGQGQGLAADQMPVAVCDAIERQDDVHDPTIRPLRISRMVTS